MLKFELADPFKELNRVEVGGRIDENESFILTFNDEPVISIDIEGRIWDEASYETVHRFNLDNENDNLIINSR